MHTKSRKMGEGGIAKPPVFLLLHIIFLFYFFIKEKHWESWWLGLSTQSEVDVLVAHLLEISGPPASTSPRTRWVGDHEKFDFQMWQHWWINRDFQCIHCRNQDWTNDPNHPLPDHQIIRNRVAQGLRIRTQGLESKSTCPWDTYIWA